MIKNILKWIIAITFIVIVIGIFLGSSLPIVANWLIIGGVIFLFVAVGILAMLWRKGI